MQLSVKYRFLHPREASWLLDVAAFPALSVSTAPRRLDTGHASFFPPVWLEKDFAKWSVFGGGGYDIDPGRSQHDYGLMGRAVMASAGPGLQHGAQVNDSAFYASLQFTSWTP